MCVLFMLFAILLHATSTVNAIECWVGGSSKAKVPVEKKSIDSITVQMTKMECSADTKRCLTMTCKLDTEAMREVTPGERIPDGARTTSTLKMCMPPEEKSCEIPEKGLGIVNGVDTNKIKNYCRVSCCTGNACNGTLGLRSFGTVAAMLAFIAAFFLRWN